MSKCRTSLERILLLLLTSSLLLHPLRDIIVLTLNHVCYVYQVARNVCISHGILFHYTVVQKCTARMTDAILDDNVDL